MFAVFPTHNAMVEQRGLWRARLFPAVRTGEYRVSSLQTARLGIMSRMRGIPSLQNSRAWFRQAWSDARNSGRACSWTPRLWQDRSSCTMARERLSHGRLELHSERASAIIPALDALSTTYSGMAPVSAVAFSFQLDPAQKAPCTRRVPQFGDSSDSGVSAESQNQ